MAKIPVIFLSANNEIDAKVRALRGGGNDYITKPFIAEEVLARIYVHLEIHRLRLELKAHNDFLEEQIRLRTQELEQAKDRLAMLEKTKK